MKNYFVLLFAVILLMAFTLEAKAELSTAANRLGISRAEFEKPQKRKVEKPLQLSGQNKDERIGIARQEKIQAYKPVRSETTLGKSKIARPEFLKPQLFRAEGAARLSGVNRQGIGTVKSERPQSTQFQRPNKITTGNMR